MYRPLAAGLALLLAGAATLLAGGPVFGGVPAPRSAESLFHYKYVQKVSTVALVEKRSSRATLRFYRGNDWNYSRHSTVIAVKDVAHHLENASFRIHRESHTNPTTRVTCQPHNRRHYAELTCEATHTGGSIFNSLVDLELTADEYEHQERVTEYFSDLFRIDGNRFSIVLPSNTPSDPAGNRRETTATLTLIHDGTATAYDPYTFSEDARLKKVNTLPHGSDRVELLFMLK